jgi:Kef-type K+ transport system membrane component KefB
VGIGAAVTSIPVISRLFIDLNLMDTRFARSVVTAATIQDLILWAILAVATAIQQGQGSDPVDLGRVAVMTLVFALLSFALGPRALRIVGRFGVERFTEASLFGYTLLVCLAFVTIASLLDINVVFGALVAGLVIGRFPSDMFKAVKQRIADLSLWFFVPIYFALVGLRLDLSQHLDWRLTLVFLAASTAVKLASVMVAARSAGLGWNEALDYGVAMNTRGGPGIVVASVGLASGIIDERMFTALVLASLVTSLAAGIWFRWRRARISLIGAKADGVRQLH